MVELTLPYIPSFLAFREAPFLKERVDELKRTKPEILPQVILVDGNGILHTRGFGLASHFGVISDIPTIGVAKKLFSVDGLSKNSHHLMLIQTLKKAGDTFPLIGHSGKTWGLAMRGHDFSHNPIYVSCGHKLSLKTAQTVVYQCCRSRIPEPIRQADLRSREVIRKLYGPKGSPKKKRNQKRPDKRSSSKQNQNYNTKHGPTKPQLILGDRNTNLEDNSDDDNN